MFKLHNKVIMTVMIGICLGLISPSDMRADSLWTDSTQSIYNTVKMPHIGDIITIYVSDKSSAVHEAGTNTSKRTSLSADFYDMWDQYAINAGENDSLRKMQNYRIGGNDDYAGLGKTSRKSRVKTVISVVVTEILDNGNLVISGEHTININDEKEVIRISGIIRPQDISDQNTVFSHQVAKAKVSVRGDGVVGAKQTPGLMSKVFNWVF